MGYDRYLPGGSRSGDDDIAWLYVYPAAHLEVYDVVVSPATTIGVCDEFTVTYKVRNTGEADAWEVEATLAVSPDGSVRPSEGDNGYSQYIGTIPGWGSYSGEIQFVEKTFDLHCKLACESTLTITPSGNDECGWFPIPKIDGDFEPKNGPPWCHEYTQLPGREIQSEFIEPASVTVKQIDLGGLDLAITKTVRGEWTGEGIFDIVVTNNGPTDATGVEVEDSQPTGLTFGTVTVSQGAYAGGVWTVGYIPAGGFAMMSIEAADTTSDPVTNTAEITAVDQPDAFPENDSASVTVNAVAPTSASIGLVTGWNLISLELIPTGGGDLDTFFAGIASSMDIIWSYEGGGWTSWTPTLSGDLAAVSDGKGYWIKMTGPDTLEYAGVEMITDPPQPPPTYDVVVGWNLIGFKSTTPMAAGDYLNSLTGISRIYGFENGMFTAVTSGDMMMPGMGYWLAVSATGTIYP